MAKHMIIFLHIAYIDLGEGQSSLEMQDVLRKCTLLNFDSVLQA